MGALHELQQLQMASARGQLIATACFYLEKHKALVKLVATIGLTGNTDPAC
jgi:hypothetical protein